MPPRSRTTLPLVQPIVPVLRGVPFDDPAWLFEPKYDGFRGLLYVAPRHCWSGPSGEHHASLDIYLKARVYTDHWKSRRIQSHPAGGGLYDPSLAA